MSKEKAHKSTRLFVFLTLEYPLCVADTLNPTTLVISCLICFNSLCTKLLSTNWRVFHQFSLKFNQTNASGLLLHLFQPPSGSRGHTPPSWLHFPSCTHSSVVEIPTNGKNTSVQVRGRNKSHPVTGARLWVGGCS